MDTDAPNDPNAEKSAYQMHVESCFRWAFAHAAAVVAERRERRVCNNATKASIYWRRTGTYALSPV